MNILLTSVGRRGYLVQYFKEVLSAGDRVFGADNSAYAPGLVYCDVRGLLPRVSDSGYVDAVLEFCVIHQIHVVIPLLDPELNLFAEARRRFSDIGTLAIISPPQTVTTAYDKFLTYEFAVAHNIAVPRTFLTLTDALAAVNAGQAAWPLVVKPRKGSASINISYCTDTVQLEAAMELCQEPMIQECLRGDEYGFDLFGDADGKPVSVYCKKKLAMRAGETDKAISVDDPLLIAFGRRLLEALPLVGPCDVDVIMTGEGPKLLEINPRFGGGYPCSHLAGADFCRKIIDLRNGKPLVCDIGQCPGGIVMLKQDEIIRCDWNGADKDDSGQAPH